MLHTAITSPYKKIYCFYQVSFDTFVSVSKCIHRNMEKKMKKLSFLTIAFLAAGTTQIQSSATPTSNLTILEIAIKTANEALASLNDVRDYQAMLEHTHEMAEKMRDSQGNNASPSDREPIERFYRDATFYSSRSTANIKAIEHAANNLKMLADKVKTDSFAGTKTINAKKEETTNRLRDKHRRIKHTVDLAKEAAA